MKKSAVLLIAALALAACKAPAPDKAVGWDVYKNGKRVLWMLDQPGTFETSAGPAPPGIPAYTSPFLTATAHDPADEDHLRALAEKAKGFDAYVAALKAEGYAVVPVGTKPAP